MTTATTSLYDEVLLLIGVAETIDDAAKKKMIEDVQKNGLSPIMQKALQELFHAEAGRLTTEINEAQNAVQAITDLDEETELELDGGYEWLGEEYDKAAEEISMEHNAACSAEINALEKGLEGDKQVAENDEMANIRSMLKQDDTK